MKTTENHKRRNLSLINVDIKPLAKLLLTFVIMVLLVFVVYKFNIPNPNMILIAGLVICSALFGYYGGVVATIIMFGYTLFFFSKGNDFITFDLVNRNKVIVSFIGIIVDMIFVCELKRRMDKSFREVRNLTNKLSEDNVRLHEASQIDSLTKIKNRLALRLDYNSYTGKTLAVAMIDIDNFKQLNDQYGHIIGDKVLEATGRLLSDLFGQNNSYRYGGDEFLIIVPDPDKDEFETKLQHLAKNSLHINSGEKVVIANYSIGYLCETESAEYPLRSMISDADDRMYEDKRRTKNTNR